MTAVQFRNPEVRLSEALQSTRDAVSGHAVTLRELLSLVGEQGLLVFCSILAMPFLLPVTLPFMSTALGLDASNVCATFESNPTGLFNILAYHVTEGRRFSNSVFNKRSVKMVEMLNDQYIVTNPNLTINDAAGRTINPVVPFVNLNASNGVIHVIDAVLLPN